ncbi:hypothetical protein C8A01DRAFT_21078 [Parachaetomium inaequale]|uniref:Uncharacterized protein n=1 Tax=Parachaetomium inaequale TaxID=2588326 RepID=A0AAN6P6P1_9PEZI|nr:hypothetical protein C8A01DRAFT_21078 [Parachaetomium inaequale]
MKEKESEDSIFGFLTRKNPEIEYPPPKSKGVTSRRYYLCPTELRVWKDFNFSTLEAIYGRKLIEEARRTGASSLNFPRVSAIDRVVDDEPTTISLLTIWNRSIVNAALEEAAILNLFHPCIWRAKTGQNISTEKSAKKVKHRLKPDAGAVSLCTTCLSAQSPSLALERLPKDYKTASKWESLPFLRQALTNETGEGEGKWKTGEMTEQAAMPIRQVYTYCVKSGCRYGCILTTAEAFIFRIKPRTEMRDSATTGGCSSKTQTINQALKADGLMEYVSIPWENHNHDDPDNYADLTVNLALWFVHILAGNAHRVDWSYPKLWEEQLATDSGVCTARSAAEDPEPEPDCKKPEPPQKWRSSRPSSHSRKRRRNSAVSDVPHFSFSQSSAPQVFFPLTITPLEYWYNGTNSNATPVNRIPDGGEYPEP